MTSVVIVGRVLDSIDENTRLVEIVRPYKNSEGAFEKFIIHARHWNKTATCAFMQLKNGISVCFKGRLESDDKLGIYILIEHVAGAMNEV